MDEVTFNLAYLAFPLGKGDRLAVDEVIVNLTYQSSPFFREEQVRTIHVGECLGAPVDDIFSNLFSREDCS